MVVASSFLTLSVLETRRARNTTVENLNNLVNVIEVQMDGLYRSWESILNTVSISSDFERFLETIFGDEETDPIDAKAQFEEILLNTVQAAFYFDETADA